MIETRQLNIGDLVYGTDHSSLGMIISFDMGYLKFHVEWFDGISTDYSWMQAQRMRNNYLDLRNNMK